MADNKNNDQPALADASRWQAGALGPARSAELKIALPFGLLAFVGAFGSLATCYSVIVANFIWNFEAQGPNPHLQAVAMWSFALIAVYALWRDRKVHGGNLPLVLGVASTAILLFLLYVSYDRGIEIFAYVLLVIAALLNQNSFLGALNRTVERQAVEIASLNRSLERKVENQVKEIDRLSQLKQFVAPEVADLVAEGQEKLLESHRRYIASLFCDIRGFTAVSEALEPEEVMSILQAYHERVGDLIARHRGTIGYRAGDGLMVFFNDPVPCEEPVLEAVRLALAIREAFESIRAPWSRLGHGFGLGLAVASGYATLGLVGFRGRADYTAIGGVVNVAARLCDRAADGEILLNQRAFCDVEATVRAEPLGAFELKGVRLPVDTYRLLDLADEVGGKAGV